MNHVHANHILSVCLRLTINTAVLVNFGWFPENAIERDQMHLLVFTYGELCKDILYRIYIYLFKRMDVTNVQLLSVDCSEVVENLQMTHTSGSF